VILMDDEPSHSLFKVVDLGKNISPLAAFQNLYIWQQRRDSIHKENQPLNLLRATDFLPHHKSVTPIVFSYLKNESHYYITICTFHCLFSQSVSFYVSFNLHHLIFHETVGVTSVVSK
jgi:hypothetical protein